MKSRRSRAKTRLKPGLTRRKERRRATSACAAPQRGALRLGEVGRQPDRVAQMLLGPAVALRREPVELRDAEMVEVPGAAAGRRPPRRLVLLDDAELDGDPRGDDGGDIVLEDEDAPDLGSKRSHQSAARRRSRYWCGPGLPLLSRCRTAIWPAIQKVGRSRALPNLECRVWAFFLRKPAPGQSPAARSVRSQGRKPVPVAPLYRDRSLLRAGAGAYVQRFVASVTDA